MAATLRRLRIISLIEGATYLILLAAAVAKRAADNAIGVQIMGPVHGVFFLVFAYMILIAYSDIGWTFAKAVKGIVLGAVPFGAFWLERNWLHDAEPETR